MMTETDVKGNQLFRNGDDILLRLVSENHNRKIGKIIEDKKLLEVHRDSKKHFFFKGSAYGFNDALLRSATKFDKIGLIIDNKDRYLIPISVIREQGTYLQFSQQGFEIQIFLKMSIIENYKVN